MENFEKISRPIKIDLIRLLNTHIELALETIASTLNKPVREIEKQFRPILLSLARNCYRERRHFPRIQLKTFSEEDIPTRKFLREKRWTR